MPQGKPRSRPLLLLRRRFSETPVFSHDPPTPPRRRQAADHPNQDRVVSLCPGSAERCVSLSTPPVDEATERPSRPAMPPAYGCPFFLARAFPFPFLFL